MQICMSMPAASTVFRTSAWSNINILVPRRTCRPVFGPTFDVFAVVVRIATKISAQILTEIQIHLIRGARGRFRITNLNALRGIGIPTRNNLLLKIAAIARITKNFDTCIPIKWIVVAFVRLRIWLKPTLCGNLTNETTAKLKTIQYKKHESYFRLFY